MAKDRENAFNRVQNVLSEIHDPSAKDLTMAQLASDFHQDLRQKEMIEELAAFKLELASTVSGISNLKTAIDPFNKDSGKLYVAYLCLTLAITLATIINPAMAVGQVLHLFH
jgi:hypothetical protein